jgi:hypothetical protein
VLNSPKIFRKKIEHASRERKVELELRPALACH